MAGEAAPGNFNLDRTVGTVVMAGCLAVGAMALMGIEIQ